MTSAATSHMKHMWRGLLEEILVCKVLQCLPMKSLCQFWTICKNWNTLPTQNDFAAQHAIASPVEEFVLITLQSMWSANSLRGCLNVLDDVAISRVFLLSPVSHNNLLATSARCGNIILARNRKWKFLTADGGLFLVCWYDNSNGPSLLVCNPILMAKKVIPWPCEWFQIQCTYFMFTNIVSMEYEILVDHHTNDMDIFELKTGRWKRVVNIGMSSLQSWYSKSKFVKFKNMMYRLCIGYRNNEKVKPYLIGFEKKTGVGSMLDFLELFPGNNKDCMRTRTLALVVSLCRLELVVSLGQLFCVYRLYQKHDNCLEVFEVFPKRQEWKNFVRMPKALLHWIDSDLEVWPRTLEFIGCASSILFCSRVMDQYVAYDLASKSWHQLTHNCLVDKYFCIPRTNFGLSLCPP